MDAIRAVKRKFPKIQMSAVMAQCRRCLRSNFLGVDAGSWHRPRRSVPPSGDRCRRSEITCNMEVRAARNSGRNRSSLTAESKFFRGHHEGARAGAPTVMIGGFCRHRGISGRDEFFIKGVPSSRTEAWDRWARVEAGSADRYSQRTRRPMASLVPEGLKSKGSLQRSSPHLSISSWRVRSGMAIAARRM